MKNLKYILLLIAALAIAAYLLIPGSKKPAASTDKTQIQIFNTTNSATTVWITLGATEGCLHQVDSIPFITNSNDSLVGSFILAAHDSTIAYCPTLLGFNGNICFNTQPLNCASEQFPNGTNPFEFIINNSFQAGNPQETIDISCVAGVNSFIHVGLSGGSSWNASSAYPGIQDFSNSDIKHNSGRAGVYPFSCDSCTTMYQPPSCDTVPTDKQKQQICNVQRNAKGSKGGLIKVVYMGHMQPLK